ncbi:MAG: metallophosphoesterase family protein [Chloroflexota bacterium]
MRLLHIADVHLDRPFARLDRERGDRDRARLRRTFVRCLDRARELEVDTVTIGGDLWEDEHVSPDTRRFVSNELGELDCPALMICGNHDPNLPGGNYARTAWPNNVHLFPSETLAEYPLDEEVSIWGVSWGGGQLSAKPLLQQPPPLDLDRANLLLLHGTAESSGEDGHCPFNGATVREAGFAHCLAGHIHAAETNADYTYPGSPEPLGWGELGRHCCAVVEVTDGHIEVRLEDVGEHRYEILEVDCEGAEHSAEVAERLAAALPENERGELHLRAMLGGEVDPDCWIAPSELRELHAERFAELAVEDHTHPGHDLEALASKPSASGHFVRRMQEQIAAEPEEGRRQLLESALRSGLRALDGQERIVDVG